MTIFLNVHMLVCVTLIHGTEKKYAQAADTPQDADGKTPKCGGPTPPNSINNHNPKFLLTMDYGSYITQWNQTNLCTGLAVKVTFPHRQLQKRPVDKIDKRCLFVNKPFLCCR